MTKPSRSPERNTFQKENYLKRCAEEGKQPSEAYLNMWETARQEQEAWGQDPDKHANDMEWDLRTTDWILHKVRASEAYAQNLYAAMCNMRFQKHAVMPILKDEYWSCSWRYAGGIVADMRGEGDYIDWYCSGIRNASLDEAENAEWDKRNFVGEGFVTEEIADDLYKLGWVVSPWPEDKL